MIETKPYTDEEGEIQEYHIEKQGDQRVNQAPIPFDKTFFAVKLQSKLLVLYLKRYELLMIIHFNDSHKIRNAEKIHFFEFGKN